MSSFGGPSCLPNFWLPPASPAGRAEMGVLHSAKAESCFPLHRCNSPWPQLSSCPMQPVLFWGYHDLQIPSLAQVHGPGTCSRWRDNVN